jgi:hypothetical protein
MNVRVRIDAMSVDPNLLRPDKRGYINVQRKGKQQWLHRLIAEAALGKPLPKSTEVHHVNVTSDNYSLVVCPGRAYHKLIHARERASNACGNPNFRKCKQCGTYGDPTDMSVHPRGGGRTASYHHKGCHAMEQRVYRWRSGKSQPFGAAGLLFELLNSGNVHNMPFPGDEVDEVDPMELTERSLRAAGFVESPDSGAWIHSN